MKSNNILYLKILNKENIIKNDKIPYELETKNLYQKCHDKLGNLSYKRVIKEKKAANYYWKTISNNCLNYVSLHPTCLKSKAGTALNPKHKLILTKAY